MHKRILVCVAAAMLLLPCVLWADQISFGYSATSAVIGPTLLNGETQSIGNGTDIWMYLKGHATSTSPVLLIIGVPNDPSEPPNNDQLSQSSITGYQLWNNTLTSSVAGTMPAGFSGGTGYSTITSHNTLGFAGDFTSGDLYKDFFGISSITASNQFQSNWQSWDQQLFPTLFPPPNQPINYGIYVFGLTFPTGSFNTGSSRYIEVSLGAELPIGSYAVGYSIDSSNGQDNFTPFTVAGLVNHDGQVPEPATLGMFGTGLLVVGVLVRRRLR